MKNLKQFTFIVCMLMAFSTFAQTDKDKKIMSDADDAKAALIKKDPGLTKYFENAAGYALFPNVGKGGFIVGGAAGNGVVYENGVAVGMADLKKLDIGLQAGGQAIIQVIFFETDVDLARFKEGNFKFSAEATAVAVEKGVAVNTNYNEGIATFALPKAGLMASASVGGQKFSYNAFY
ncbi:lipid-binding SYLF domain-containing protein [Gelidibacter maritimus]|uniref:Lipid-binding SYLF domain-containing protein n=1 Tax=Gelidibacter maritimus TaxID=2761487 RepID=A0A7W2M5T8_9FLAO|nr:lipid-binding SYLF domain-containing protein [Gelidibacter maritimus]MBA6153021.1 lipid-binding SYLF domain-containing protein [Gelidibacter maritimus]